MNMYWLLEFLPQWIIYSLLFAGVSALLVAFFVQFIPFVNIYRHWIKGVASILVVCGVYLAGGLAYKESIAKKVSELELALAKAEAKSAKVNTVIVENIVKDTEVIRLKGKTVTEYIDREVTKYDDSCVLPEEVITAHNMAVNLTTAADEEKK